MNAREESVRISNAKLNHAISVMLAIADYADRQCEAGNLTAIDCGFGLRVISDDLREAVAQIMRIKKEYAACNGTKNLLIEDGKKTAEFLHSVFGYPMWDDIDYFLDDESKKKIKEIFKAAEAKKEAEEKE